MTVSMREFFAQDADLLPAREALQASVWDTLGSLLNGGLGLGTDVNRLPVYNDTYPDNFLHSGLRPLPAIV
jgi:hypothetical protein